MPCPWRSHAAVRRLFRKRRECQTGEALLFTRLWNWLLEQVCRRFSVSKPTQASLAYAIDLCGDSTKFITSEHNSTAALVYAGSCCAVAVNPYLVIT